MTITAEKVKVLLYDAKLTIKGRKYTLPSLTQSNLKGKFESITSAYTTIEKNGISFSNGIYFQFKTDLIDGVISSGIDKDVTYDLNGHSWTGTTGNRARAIAVTVSSGKKVNIIDGTLKDCHTDSSMLGGAIYVNNTIDKLSSVTDRDWPYQGLSDWSEMNIFKVTFENNSAACGGAICINGAVKLNIFNSTFTGNESAIGNIHQRRNSSGAAIFVYETDTLGSGEIVNLYDCEFTKNTGTDLFAMDKEASHLFNIYGGKFHDNTLYGHGALIWLSAFNIYGGSFTDNKLGTSVNKDETYSLYCGNDLFHDNPNTENYMAKFGIYGGIIANNESNDVFNINSNDNDNYSRISFKGGSINKVVTNSGDYNLSQKDLLLASVTLPEAAKVEYVTYGADGSVNINSPFNIDSDGNAVYKYETGKYSESDEVFNGPDFNPEITQFSVFLPTGDLSNISSITVHCADNKSFELNKSETDGNITFSFET